jgi:hypothetical protein
MTEQAATIPGGRFQRMAQEALAVWRRLPFTTTVVVAMLIVGLATGALWRQAMDQPWYPDVAFGLPSFVAGRWWTLVSGAFFALTPWFYLPLVGSFALFVGWAEFHLGTRLTVAVTVVGQVLAVLGAALFLFVVQSPDWPWATATATQLDVGFSAGALAVAAVASAMLRPPWRLRVRLALGIYALAAAFYTGTPADLEHFLAVAIGLAAGPRITRGLNPPATGRPSRREWRLLAVAGMLLVAVTSVVTYFVPDDGPLGPDLGATQDLVDLAITLVLVLLLIRGLRRGKRLTWWFTVVIAGLNVFLGLAIAVLGVLIAIFGGDLDIDNGLPRFAADKLLWTAVFVILIVGRRAFRVPSRRRVRRSTATAAIDHPTAV